MVSVRSLSPGIDPESAAASRTKHQDPKQRALRRISEASYVGKIEVDDAKTIKLGGSSYKSVDAIPAVQMLPTIVDENISHDPPDMAPGQYEKDVTIVKPVVEENNTTKTTAEPLQVVVQPAERIDYFAGFTAVAGIGVTLHHFGQTFW